MPMPTIRCLHCGSPAKVLGSRWECGYCGDFGSISSPHPSEKAKLVRAATPTVQVTITVTDTSDEETPHNFPGVSWRIWYAGGTSTKTSGPVGIC